MMKWLDERLNEPTTWLGIVVALAIVCAAIWAPAERYENIKDAVTMFGAAISGALVAHKE